MQTRAILARPAGGLTAQAIPLPAPGPHEAVVRVRYGGICGSDLHYWKDGRVGESVLREPMVLGHEVVGEVERTADDGSGPTAGSPVFVHPASVCGHCRQCRAGRSNLCIHLRYMGSAARLPHTPGGFADRLVVPTGRLLAIEGIPLARAALIEPAAVAWHGVNRAAGRAELSAASVLVVGCGPIGLLVIAVLRARYPGVRITAVDLQAHALTAALAVGADAAVLATELEPAEPADVAFESSGSAPGLGSALRAVRPGGTVVAVGQLPDPVTAPLHLLPGRELDLLGSSRFAGEASDVIAALRHEGLAVDDVISHRFPADEVLDAFGTAADAARSSKVLLDFRTEEEYR